MEDWRGVEAEPWRGRGIAGLVSGGLEAEGNSSCRKDMEEEHRNRSRHHREMKLHLCDVTVVGRRLLVPRSHKHTSRRRNSIVATDLETKQHLHQTKIPPKNRQGQRWNRKDETRSAP
ncbi:hypothetical protein ACLB2K_004770 [Fragaria x ananassa]